MQGWLEKIQSLHLTKATANDRIERPFQNEGGAGGPGADRFGPVPSWKEARLRAEVPNLSAKAKYINEKPRALAK